MARIEVQRVGRISSAPSKCCRGGNGGQGGDYGNGVLEFVQRAQRRRPWTAASERGAWGARENGDARGVRRRHGDGEVAEDIFAKTSLAPLLCSFSFFFLLITF